MQNIENIAKELGFNKEIEEFLNAHFSFRYNEITGRIEYRSIKKNSFRELTDFDLNSVIREIEHNKIRYSTTKLRSLLYSNYVPRYDPVKEYLSKLPENDENNDYIKELSSTIQTSDQQKWNKYLTKWLVAWVASLLDDSKINHTVIVLNGDQGIGKSRWLSKLVPEALSKYVFAGTINPDNKDTLIYLSECVLINLDEFENLNRNQLGGIKELITKENIKLRRPYGYSAENLPRRASFVASVNKHEFLTDVTGNRRFLCFEALKIDYNHNINMDLVFSQALALYNKGYEYWLNSDDIAEINASNENFRAISLEEEALMTYYEPTISSELLLSTTEILSKLSDLTRIPVNTASRKRLGEALRKNHFQRVKRKGRYLYSLRERLTKSDNVYTADLKPAA